MNKVTWRFSTYAEVTVEAESRKEARAKAEAKGTDHLDWFRDFDNLSIFNRASQNS